MDEKDAGDKSSSVSKRDTESTENTDNKDYNQLRSIFEKSLVKDYSNKSKLHNYNINRTLKRPNSVILPAKSNIDLLIKHVTNSLPASQEDSSEGISNNVGKKQIHKWSYLGNVKSRPASYPPSQWNKDSDLEDGTHFHLNQTFSPLVVKENEQCDKTLNLPSVPNHCDASFNKVPKESNTDESKFRVFPSKEKDIFEAVSKTVHEKTDETDSQTKLQILETSVNDNESKEKLKEIKPSLSVKEETRTHRSLSENGLESRLSSISTTDSKMKVPRSNGENLEDESFFDDIWMHYVERTLLPLKPLQKQRSLSCTNLVQAIKGFSKKKTGTNNRFSSPENILVEEKETFGSAVNISHIPDRKQTDRSDDEPIQRVDKDDSFESKDSSQSLNHYQWYHMVDAKDGNKRLLNLRQNGAFLIRPASNPTAEVSHTLSVVYGCRVYNFHIKNLEDGHFSLGGRKKKETFSSLLELIKYHQNVPITIRFAGLEAQVHLLITPPK